MSALAYTLPWEVMCLANFSMVITSVYCEMANAFCFWVFIDDRRLPSFKPRPGLLLWPPFGTIGCSFDCWCKDTKNFCIYQIFACDKERFSAKHFRFETSLKNKLYVLWGASLCFCGVENYVLRYKSVYYKVIPDCRETCSVFSIQFFSLLLPSSV